VAVWTAEGSPGSIGLDMSEEKRPERSNLGRSYSSGFEFVAAVVGFTLIGFWIDYHYGSSPKALLIGLGLGLVGATWNLIRGSWTANRKTDRTAKPKNGEPGE
jgi:F0F1-type ATP synthase assembly protein I